MSKIAVNEITDEVGTGAPAFPNGMSVTGAALTDPEITGGIYLGGTGSANYLEDYEEGTWTPTIQSTSGFAGTSLSVQYAIYTKICGLVHISAGLRFPDSSGTLAVGDFAKISGLPFTYGGSGGGFRAQGPINFSRDVTNGGLAHGYLRESNMVFARVVAVNGNGARNDQEMFIQIAYRTDS